MSIEGYGLFSEEQLCSTAQDVFFERNWNGRKISLEPGNISCPAKEVSLQRLTEIKRNILPLKGSAGGSIEGKTNSEGTSSLETEIHVSSTDKDGNTVSVAAEGSIKSDRDGNISADGGVKVSFEMEF